MKIHYSAYKYAPETAGACVNGIKLDLHDTMIGSLICCQNHKEAIKELKKLYRKTIAKENRYLYAFFKKDSKQFYYVECLNFPANASLQERLYNYKELKHHLQNHPIEIIAESGHITPIAAQKPEVKKEVVTIDFSKCRKMRIV